MQKSQTDFFLCLMLMVQENIITTYITEDSNAFFSLTVFLSCFSLFFETATFLFNFSALCVW